MVPPHLERLVSCLPLVGSSSSLGSRLQGPFYGTPGGCKVLPEHGLQPSHTSCLCSGILEPIVTSSRTGMDHLCIISSKPGTWRVLNVCFHRERKDQSTSISPRGPTDLGSQRNCDKNVTNGGGCRHNPFLTTRIITTES